MPDPLSTEEKLKKIFVNPEHQAKVVDILVNNKPRNWSRRSNAPYYREVYALEVKAVIDRMLVDRLDSCYDYEHFKKIGMNRDTVYTRVYQGIRYLLDNLDTEDHKYARFMEMVRLERDRGVGVVLRFIPEFREANVSSFTPTKVIPKEKVPQWKDDITEYLEKGEAGKPLFIDKLALTTEEINDIKLSLHGLKGVISNITAHSIKIIKTNYEG